AYMSPEQAAGREDIDGRADLWSLGIVMYEALTGTLPYEAANYNALMVRILTQDADPIQTRKTDLPQPLCAIVDACLRRERDQRTQSAGVLASQMESVLREMRALRYRSEGRRAADRAPGGFKRRASDLGGGALAADRRTPLLIAAAVGLAIGVVTVVLVMIVL